jgi:hypothetical protein
MGTQIQVVDLFIEDLELVLASNEGLHPVNGTCWRVIGHGGDVQGGATLAHLGLGTFDVDSTPQCCHRRKNETALRVVTLR